MGTLGKGWGGTRRARRWAAAETENASSLYITETAVITQNKVSQRIFCSREGEALMQSLVKKSFGSAEH